MDYAQVADEILRALKEDLVLDPGAPPASLERRVRASVLDVLSKSEALSADRAAVRGALLDLLAYVPEGSRPSDYVDVTGSDKQDAAASDGAPLISESFLYIMLGKSDARSFLSRISRLCDALGWSMDAVELDLAHKTNLPGGDLR